MLCAVSGKCDVTGPLDSRINGCNPFYSFLPGVLLPSKYLCGWEDGYGVMFCAQRCIPGVKYEDVKGRMW